MRSVTADWRFRREDNALLIQSIRFTFAPEDDDKVEAIFRELREASRKEEGVMAFEVARSQEKPNVFVLWEEYRDEAALDSHKATEHYKRLVLDGVRPLALERTGEMAVPI
jgi:autoinducer 2-degrading protein